MAQVTYAIDDEMYGQIYLTVLTDVNILRLNGMSGLLNTILVVELFNIILNVFFVVVISYFALLQRAVHLNLSLIFVAFICIFIPMAFIRGYYIVVKIWMTEDNGSMIPYLCGSRTVYLMLMVVAMPTALSERACASLYLEDYERTSRRHIPVLLFMFYSAFSVFLSMDFFTRKESAVVCVIYASFMSIVSLSLYFLLEHWNRKKLKRLGRFSPDCPYSLSIRFQLAENIRVFKMFRTVFIVVTFCSLVVSVMMVIMFFTEDPVKRQVENLFIEYAISGLPLCVYVPLFLSNENWRLALCRWITRRNEPGIKKKVKVDKSNETNEYFRNLQDSWK